MKLGETLLMPRHGSVSNGYAFLNMPRLVADEANAIEDVAVAWQRFRYGIDG
jgi:hypothetical protein